MIIDKLHAKLDTKKFTEFTRVITFIYEPTLLWTSGVQGP